MSEIKKKNDYRCSKCSHYKFTVRKKNFATDCNRCRHIESPTAGTMFHKVKFGIKKAFLIGADTAAQKKKKI